VGVDLVSVEEVQEALRVHSNRYLARIFSTREIDDCRNGPDEVAAERLAARFAAKEAALKILRRRPDGAEQAIPWSDIEVVRDPSGAPDLVFSGRAAELAREANLGSVAVSLTHQGTHAAAIVVAETRTDES
jgi:holo-[acyl-carrier protein] synthase